MNLGRIERLSFLEQKRSMDLLAKLMEECGELASEVAIDDGVVGYAYKNPGEDGIRGECVDILLVVLCLYFKNGGSIGELEERVMSKCDKWEKVSINE